MKDGVFFRRGFLYDIYRLTRRGFLAGKKKKGRRCARLNAAASYCSQLQQLCEHAVATAIFFFKRLGFIFKLA
jgi:hypothetical protein